MRIYIVAGSVNALMIPDRVKVDQIKWLLQKFHGSKFITTIEFSSDFLQLILYKYSRKSSSSVCNQVYQYKVVPYGFKNSLSAFIRVLVIVLCDGLEEYGAKYVHDVDRALSVL